MNKQPIRDVPTHLITGFLGTGKTSTIIDLLKQKPSEERWALLINEFGEIGIDGALLQGLTAKSNTAETNATAQAQGIFISEVPGGCMCCASGLPMQIALNQLLTKARPHRLLIEPTGLGHPQEVLQVLMGEHYQGVLDIQRVVTLVDPRKISDSRYTEHPTFQQQLTLAEIVVANKQDLATTEDQATLIDYLNQLHPSQPTAQIIPTQHGQLSLTDILGNSRHQAQTMIQRMSKTASKRTAKESEGYTSYGWQYSAEQVFEFDKLVAVLDQIPALRVKAVFICQEGILGYNRLEQDTQLLELEDCLSSRLELISVEEIELAPIKAQLDQCLLSLTSIN